MKKILLGICSLLVAVSAMASSKSTKPVEIKGSFDGISTSGNVEVSYTAATKVSVSIKAVRPDMDKVKFELKNKTLHIYTEGQLKDDIKVTVKSPAVSRFDAVGNSEIDIENTISAHKLQVKAAGNAEIDFEAGINATEISVEAQGNASVKLERGTTCDAATVRACGNASVRVPDLNGNKLDISAEGNATARARRVAVNSIKASSVGNATVKLTGHAGTVAYTSAGNSILSANELTANGGIANAQGNSTIHASVAGLQKTSSNNATITNNL